MIKGYDQEKYDLLPSFMAWGQPYFLSDYFNHFNSPHYLFSLVRETFLQYGMRVNMLLFKEALNRQFCRNPQEFSVGLLRMLSDDYAIIRYAGVQVLMSRHTGVYDINFLELDEEHQLRIIKTLLCSPHNIEDLMPLILVLRHSPYQEVARKLESGLIELIQAYGYHLIKLTQQHLSSESTADEALILVLNQAYAKHKEQQDAKKQVKELNPIENELEYLEFFYELEQEKKVESMARAQSKSVFNELVSTVHIIRGSAFASESNPTISPLGKIEISRLVDQRYNINPEMYEWQFRLDATTSNYKDSEEQ